MQDSKLEKRLCGLIEDGGVGDWGWLRHKGESKRSYRGFATSMSCI